MQSVYYVGLDVPTGAQPSSFPQLFHTPPAHLTPLHPSTFPKAYSHAPSSLESTVDYY